MSEQFRIRDGVEFARDTLDEFAQGYLKHDPQRILLATLILQNERDKPESPVAHG